MDRDALARKRRRKQAQEQLEEEREREALLADQLEERLSEVEGPRIDEEVFERLSAEEAGLIRGRLGAVPGPFFEGEATEEEAGWLEGLDEEDPGAARAELEDEISRLEQELETCRARQRAYARYLELLG